VRLSGAVRLTCSATIQLASASDVAAVHSRNPAAQQALASEVQATKETMAVLVTSVREATDVSVSSSVGSSGPDAAGIRAARRLVERSREMVQVRSWLTSSCRTFVHARRALASTFPRRADTGDLRCRLVLVLADRLFTTSHASNCCTIGSASTLYCGPPKSFF